MPCRSPLIVAAALLLLAGAAARAEVTVVIERSDAAAFKDKGIPAPSRNDAASNARFSLVDGRPDSNSGQLEVLRDGRLPAKADEPDRNFFFEQKLDGGRIAIDLGHVIRVKQVNTSIRGTPGRGGLRSTRSTPPTGWRRISTAGRKKARSLQNAAGDC